MVIALAQQVLEALVYLGEHNVVVHNLQPGEIRIVQTDPLRVRLSNYGLYAVTHDEYFVDFPIGHPHYLSPEAVLVWAERQFEGPAVHVSCLPTVDVWSLGVILCEMLTGVPFWNKDTALPELFATLERLYQDFGTGDPSGPPCNGVNRWKQIRKSPGYSSLNHQCVFALLDRYDSLNTVYNTKVTVDGQEAALIELVFDCLLPMESERPSVNNLLQRGFFNPIVSNPNGNRAWELNYIPNLRSQGISSQHSSTKQMELAAVIPASLTKVNLDTLYHLWTVAGGRPGLVCAEHFGRPRVAPIEQLPGALGVLIPEPCSPVPTDPSTINTFTTAVDTSFLYHGKTAILSRSDMIRFINSRSTIRYNVNVDHFDDGETVNVDFLVGTEETAEELLDSALIIQFTATKQRDILLQGEATQYLETFKADPSLPDRLGIFPEKGAAVPPLSLLPPPSPSSPSPKGPGGMNTRVTSVLGSAGLSCPDALGQTVTQSFHTLYGLTDAQRKEYQLTRLALRERDPQYQLFRIALFQTLLAQYPASRAEIIRQARFDIPPRVRGPVWAAILGVLESDEWLYQHIDKESPNPTDKQISVDIPRCHQYHSLLGSSTGHAKLRRLLKGWLTANPHLVYWQGFDSVSAPFLALHFNNEAKAFACLVKFVQKYVPSLFVPDNTMVLHGYFAVFQHLLVFHDPDLALHLTHSGFTPELYAMPWFLTLFTHGFTLDKVFLIWDKLLVSTKSFPLFFGLAILRQVRSQLLSTGFNGHIVMFEDKLPTIDLEQCIQTAYRLCQITPPSLMRLPPECDGSVDTLSNSQIPKTASSGSSEAKPISGTEPRWSTPIRLDQRQREIVPRIFLGDLGRLGSHVTILDVRTEEEFCRGHLRHSIRIPKEVMADAPSYLRSLSRPYHVVVGETPPLADNFAERLVQASFRHVCTLHGGVEAAQAAWAEPDLTSRPTSVTTENSTDEEPFDMVTDVIPDGLCECKSTRLVLTSSKGRSEHKLTLYQCQHNSNSDQQSLRSSGGSSGALASLSGYLRQVNSNSSLAQ
ncbi:hypothetical protein IWQ62_000908 [Dispira parvispora]|uniref:TBC domain-containing protein kinase-like protein n=1 Tax=Dispira parvispora TaxID=1520584 RepID=A0A9W8AUW3_9FUNG|nr:hypothetical protein IWQ62_000908 [Dispira parvispora]